MKYYNQLPISFYKIALAAILISIFFVLQQYTNHVVEEYPFGFSWFEKSLKITATYILWAFLSPWVFGFSKNISLSGLTTTLKTIGFGLFIALVHRVLLMFSIALGFFVREGLWMDLFSTNQISFHAIGIFSSIVEMIFFISVFLFIDYYNKYLEKQKELNNAQLYALKMKLHPHFLFNTLHAISSMVDYNKEGAQKMLTRLGSLFRTILENEDQQTVSLEEELKYIKDYLDIEQVRFEEQLKVEFFVSEETLTARVPSLILQPLVENSIKHGISKMKSDGRIQIKTQKKVSENGEDRVCLTITDNGQGFGKSEHTNFGIVIKNVNDRLTRLYNEDFFFNIGPGKSNGAVAHIEIPYLQKV